MISEVLTHREAINLFITCEIVDVYYITPFGTQ